MILGLEIFSFIQLTFDKHLSLEFEELGIGKGKAVSVLSSLGSLSLWLHRELTSKGERPLDA